NDFFTIAELKNHLLQQITCEQNDDTAQRLFDSKAFSEWLNRGVTSMGELVSFRDMLKLMFHWIYYEVIPITSPMFIKAVPSTTTEIISTRKAVKSSLALSATQRSVIRDWIAITTRYDGSKGVEATLRNQLATHELTVAVDLGKQIRNFLEFGNPKVGTIIPSGFSNSSVPEKVRKNLEFIELRNRSVHPIPQNVFSSTADQLIELSKIHTKNKPSKTSGSGEQRRILNLLYDNQYSWKEFTRRLLECLSATNSGSAGSTNKRTVKTKATLDRIQAQIFRPDCFFVAPPRCNVLFPDQYTQFQYNRNYLQEITRLRLAVGMEFISGHGAGLLTPVYYSPPLSQIAELAKKQGNAGIRTLLPWEKFTGILPKFESISEVNYIANKRQQQLQQNVKGQGASYSQRSATFNFLKYRFAPRTLTVSAKFNPQFVLGFPGLVIDQPFILDQDMILKAVTQAGIKGFAGSNINDILRNITQLAKYFKAPTQYLGMPASVMHNIDQSGGTTNITFTHARCHRLTDDDFLQSFTAEITRKAQTQTISTVLDAEEIIRSGDFKQLRFLIDATPQDQIESATNANVIQTLDTENPLDVANEEPTLDLRPNGAPNLVTIDQLAPAVFSTPNPNFSNGSVVRPKTSSRTITTNDGTQIVRKWVGPTARAQLKGTRSTILSPNPYAKLKPGSVGPRGGQISQIQLFSNSVVAVSSADVDQLVRTAKDRQDLATRRKNAGKADRIFLWRKAVIWETIVSKTIDKPIPVEETIRPPWFSPLYSNLFIGDNIYQPFFGTGSIVDEGLFLTPEGGALFGSTKDQDDVMAEVSAADGDSVKISQILEKYQAKTIGTIPSIESAVDSLSYLYGEIRRQNLDVQKFIVNYTDRPIATLEDMLGSLDLEYEVQGEKLVKKSGTSGFHSTAIAPFGELMGLLDNPDLELARMQRSGKKYPISKSLDPRPDRRAAVQAYANDFGSAGALGVGLRG
ncbi:MAG: hypothetical protein KGZ30_04960, partial [Anaplasmataceae bacterium]|nr:hypothetical protein [Anaplasmataceae bacterium]